MAAKTGAIREINLKQILIVGGITLAAWAMFYYGIQARKKKMFPNQ